MMVGCGLRNGEARAVNVNNIVANDVDRVTEQVHSGTHRLAKLKHREEGPLFLSTACCPSTSDGKPGSMGSELARGSPSS